MHGRLGEQVSQIVSADMDGCVRVARGDPGRKLSNQLAENTFQVPDACLTGVAVDQEQNRVVVDGDRMFVYSGYGMFGQMPGNVLLAYQLQP